MNFTVFNCIVTIIYIVIMCCMDNVIAGAKERDQWYDSAREAIDRRLKHAWGSGPGGSSGRRVSDDVARNVVLIIGDGMGPSTLTAARILKGQRAGRPGEETDLAWDKFPAVAMSKTYNVDAQIGDSSACATALSSGVKTKYETLGLDSSAQFDNCQSSQQSKVTSILTWAQDQGKSTGIITTTRITHATPAAFYAHSPSRYWEDDSKIPPSSRKQCKDIARQLIEDEPGKNINVILGGGRRHFVSNVTPDPDLPNKEGRRLDGRNLITEWIHDKKKRKLYAEYITTKSDLDSIDTHNVDHLLGLFAYSHMEFETDRDTTGQGDPSISEMTRTALKILERNSNGFFLLIEGGKIDLGHHYNNAFRALDETLALESAVNTVLQHVDQTETLIIVTADHSHVLTLGGYGTIRGNPILGFDSKISDVDNLPYTTLMYTSGPGYRTDRKSRNNPMKNRDTLQAAAVPRGWAAHGGEDVQVYALGPLDTVLFTGTVDQSYVPHAVSFAACLGEFKDRCACLNNSCLIRLAPVVNESKINNSEPEEQQNTVGQDNNIISKKLFLIFNGSISLHKCDLLNSVLICIFVLVLRI